MLFVLLTFFKYNIYMNSQERKDKIYKTIDIDKNLIVSAINHSKDRMNYEYNRFNQNNTFRLNMILIGTLGELVFKKYLEGNNQAYEMEFQAGKFDSFDFIINNKIIEIKTSGYDKDGFEHLNLLYNSNQYQQSQNKGYDYVVLIFINGFNRDTQSLDINAVNRATIIGYIPFDAIKNYPPTRNRYYSNHKVALNNLRDLDEIL